MTRAFFTRLALGIALVACAKTDEPADPVWGKEPCAHCAMLVGDKRYAAEVAANGERRFFDDVGCMVLWLDENGGKAEHAWVRDAAGSRWIDAKGARYAQGAKTPMDFGFGPSEGGFGWDEMRDRVRARKGSGR